MKKLLVLAFASVMILGLAGSSQAAPFLIDFEDGADGTNVTIPGITIGLEPGYDLLYGDCRAGPDKYNCHSDDLGYSSGDPTYAPFHHNGNFFVYIVPVLPFNTSLTLDFQNDDGTWFKTGYSLGYANLISMDAYLTDGSMVTVTGPENIGNPMGYLLVDGLAPGVFIDYVVIHRDANSMWILDDMSGDATGVGPVPVPEPATILLLGSALIGAVGLARRKDHD